MDINTYLQDVKKRLVEDGNTVSSVQLPSGQAIVGYQSEFRWTWFATKLHLFTIIVQVPQVDASALERAIDEAANYANGMKGQFRGLQVGIAIIPTVVSAVVSDDARSAAVARPVKKWALINLPVLIDTTNKQTYTYQGKMIWGASYISWLRSRIKAVFPVM